MNKKLLFLLPIVGAMALAGCEKKQAHEHVDANHDHLCDSCGEKISNHTDADGDFKCDFCGADLSIASVALDDSSVVKSFGTGEQFSSYGLKVIATSESGSTRELEFTVSEPDMSVPGEKTVTVTADANGQAHTLTYTINVSTWSAADVAKMEAIGEANLSFIDYCGLPFLPDHNMRVETVVEDEKLSDYYITADDMDNESYLRFIDDLESYVVVSSGLYFKFIPTETVDVEGLPLDDISVFRLTPYQRGSSSNSRVFIKDEYFLLGFNAQGDFVMTSYMVNCILDGYYLGTEVNTFLDKMISGWDNYGSEMISDLPKLPYYYFSEYSSEKFIMPEVLATSSFYPISYFSSYPFSDMNDKYDLAFHIITEGNTQEILDDLVQALKDAGFELQDKEKPDITYDTYKLSNEKVGTIEYNVWPFDDKDKEIDFDVLYKAPEIYTSHLRDQIADIATLAGITLGTDPYDSGNDEDVGLYASAEGTAKLEYATENHSLELLNDIARKFLDADQGYIVKEVAELYEAKTEKEESYYSICLSKGDLEVQIFVVLDEETDGSHKVEIGILDDKYAISPADSLAAELCKEFSADDHYGLKGVDYVENEKTASFEISKDVEGGTFQAAAEANKALFESLGFELASSEGKETKSEETDVLGWTSVFDDKFHDLRITVTAVPATEEGHISVVIAVRVYRFTNPETIMKQYIEAATGQPATEESYTMDEATLTCVAQGSKAMEIADAAAFIAAANAEAAAMAGHLPEGFVADGSRVYGNYMRYAYRNAELGIEAIILIGWTETGLGTVLTLQFMPEYTVEELFMRAVLSATLGYEAIRGYDYTVSQYGQYYSVQAYGIPNTTADDIEASYTTLKNAIKAALPSMSFTDLYDEECEYGDGGTTYCLADTTGSDWFIIMLDIYYHPQAGCLVYQVTTFLY